MRRVGWCMWNPGDVEHAARAGHLEDTPGLPSACHAGSVLSLDTGPFPDKDVEFRRATRRFYGCEDPSLHANDACHVPCCTPKHSEVRTDTTNCHLTLAKVCLEAQPLSLSTHLQHGPSPHAGRSFDADCAECDALSSLKVGHEVLDWQAGRHPLLETARARADKQPVYDAVCRAACSIFASNEVLQDGGLPNKVAIETTRPVTLSLEALVGQQGSSLSDDVGDPSFSLGQLALGFGLRDIQHLVCAPFRLASFDGFLEICDPQQRRWFLGQACGTKCECHIRLLCFTDGSFTSDGHPARMGWAITLFEVVTRGTDELQCLGVDSGPVHQCIAEQAPVSAVGFPGQDLTFLSDCSSAIGCAQNSTCAKPGTVQALVETSRMKL